MHWKLHQILISHIEHLYTHPFNGPLSGTTRVSRYQKSKTNLDFTEASDSEWQWHQLGCMQVCTSLQTASHASTPPLSFFTGRMPFLMPNQQHQSTEGKILNTYNNNKSKSSSPEWYATLRREITRREHEHIRPCVITRHTPTQVLHKHSSSSCWCA